MIWWWTWWGLGFGRVGKRELGHSGDGEEKGVLMGRSFSGFFSPPLFSAADMELKKMKKLS